jgi:hypothetical protein
MKPLNEARSRCARWYPALPKATGALARTRLSAESS